MDTPGPKKLIGAPSAPSLSTLQAAAPVHSQGTQPATPEAAAQAPGGAPDDVREPERSEESSFTRRLAVGLTDRSGPRRLTVFLIAVAFETIALVAIGEVSQTRHILGMPGSLMALTVVVAAAFAGPLVGSGAALIGAGVYWVTVANMGARGSLAATLFSATIWLAAALVSAFFAAALRDEAILRRKAAVALAESRAERESQEEVERLHASLEAALLPSQPIDHPRLGVVTAYRPSEARLLLGGDFFDLRVLPDGRIGLVIGDVAGHGPYSAALGARLRAGWQALVTSDVGLPEMLASLNEMALGDDQAGEMFATVCFAWIDTNAGEALVVSAGHPTPFVLEDGRVGPLPVRPGPALGLPGKHSWPTATVALHGPSSLLFYTDGLIEARLTPGSTERIGEDGLMALLGELSTWDAAGLDRVLAHIQAGAGGSFDDDVAVVAVEWRG